jgi:hypothetical protein
MIVFFKQNQNDKREKKKRKERETINLMNRQLSKYNYRSILIKLFLLLIFNLKNIF